MGRYLHQDRERIEVPVIFPIFHPFPFGSKKVPGQDKSNIAKLAIPGYIFVNTGHLYPYAIVYLYCLAHRVLIAKQGLRHPV